MCRGQEAKREAGPRTRRSERCAAEGPRLGRNPTFLYIDVVDAGEAGEVFRLAVVEKGDESIGAEIFFFLLLCAGHHLAALRLHLAEVACVSIALRRNRRRLPPLWWRVLSCCICPDPPAPASNKLVFYAVYCYHFPHAPLAMPGLEQKRVFAPPTGALLCWTETACAVPACGRPCPPWFVRLDSS